MSHHKRHWQRRGRRQSRGRPWWWWFRGTELLVYRWRLVGLSQSEHAVGPSQQLVIRTEAAVVFPRLPALWINMLLNVKKPRLRGNQRDGSGGRHWHQDLRQKASVEDIMGDRTPLEASSQSRAGMRQKIEQRQDPILGDWKEIRERYHFSEFGQTIE